MFGRAIRHWQFRHGMFIPERLQCRPLRRFERVRYSWSKQTYHVFSNYAHASSNNRTKKNLPLYPSKSNSLQFMFIASGWSVSLFTTPGYKQFRFRSCFRRGLMTWYPYRGISMAVSAIGLDQITTQFIHLKIPPLCRVYLRDREGTG